MNRIAVLVAISLAAAAGVVGASALQDGTTLSPGDLHRDHVDTGCDDCHQPWRGVPDAKCLDCHDDLGSGGTLSTGDTEWHGEFDSDCATCHTDHRGRDGDLTVAADHDALDVSCESCHARDLREEFPPGAHWDTDCGDCHGTGDWERIRIDHDRYFPLRSEGHYGLGCTVCHPRSDYDQTTCSDGWRCHRPGTLEYWKSRDGGRYGHELEEFEEHGEDEEGFVSRWLEEREEHDEDEEWDDHDDEWEYEEWDDD